MEATGDEAKAKRGNARAAKAVLRLPDLEVAKSAVLNSLSCPDAQRGYRHANRRIRELVLYRAPLGFAARRAANWSRFNSSLDMFPCRPLSDIWAAPSGLRQP